MAEKHHVVDADVLVLGGGPTGLYAAYCAGFRGLTTAIADSLPELGGQVSAMYPEKPIFDVAGFPLVRGRDLIGGLAHQALAFDPVLLLENRVERLDHTDHGRRQFTVTTDRETTVTCSAIIVAGGIGTFTPRALPVGNEFLGRGLTHFVARVDDYRDKDVLIVGGGDSALDWALLLEPVASAVTLVHRREKFRAHQHTMAAVKDSSVDVLVPGQLRSLCGESEVEWAEVALGDGTVVRRHVDRVVAALGFTANLGPLNDWGIAIENRRHVLVDSTMRTSVPGIYAAGDITQYPGKVRLMSVGFGEAAIAVNNIAHALDPAQPVFPGHSSDRTDLLPATA